ncbi:MAG: aminotransferase class I/II-fold pyridoxal phosphate-dependent enzyme [Lachnospiraceae bacterium]|jgi:histidinol-phosphate aminotransferase|nr:aminotransferase class I/II-fold pyridoxal phosphate-dependent enzyme [Lachnospiraceae bacterium]
MFRDLVSKFVKEVPPYNFGVGDTFKPFREGVTKEIIMHKNENPFGTSPKAVAAMAEQIAHSNRYPDIRAVSLCEKLAKLHGVKTEQVMVTQGGTSALGFISEMLIREGDEVIVTTPTYPNYLNLTKKNNGVLVSVPLDDNYEPVFDEVAKAVTDKTKVIFLANPNNPTGTICDDGVLAEFIHRLPEHVVLVVDEAYFDFIERPGYRSMISEVADGVNLIIVRTFSKIYGMAGSRIGYMISNKEIIDYLQTDATGFCCNRVGLCGAEAALEDREFIEMTIRRNKEGRDYLTGVMKELGFRVWESHTNFIFFDPRIPAKYFADELYTFGVRIRGDFCQCRLSIGTMEENRIAAEAMRQIVREYKESGE